MDWLGIALVVTGFAMQAVAWIFHRRDFPTFWVSRPVWYFLYPKGVALTIGGTILAVAGVLIYLKAGQAH